jgi:8-oxo-dGTP pyrophosphatase MutT (NUDIX family)
VTHLLRFFSADDLSPLHPPLQRAESILPGDQLDRVGRLAEALRQRPYIVEVPLEDLRRYPELHLFIAVVRGFGAIAVARHGNTLHLEATERANELAGNFAYELYAVLRDGVIVFDDWFRRYPTPENLVSAIEFFQHVELQRIEAARRTGTDLELWGEIQVAYAIIKARSEKRKTDVYLLERNRSYGRYNFVGGKQKPDDLGDFEVTMRREMTEELQISADDVWLTELTPQPLETYALHHGGLLTRYRCKLYLANFRRPVTPTDGNRWFTEEELRLNRHGTGETIIHPVYMDFLLDGRQGGAKALPYSFETPIEREGQVRRVLDFIGGNEASIVGVLGILGALILIIFEIISRVF